MKKMTAKYDGRCADCGGKLYAGDKIRWSRETGALHEADEVCGSYHEQAAEMRAEQAFEAHLMGYGAAYRAGELD